MDADHETLNAEELELLKIYFSKLAELQGHQECDLVNTWTDDELSQLTSIYTQIEKFGGGDPIKAAMKHMDVLNGVSEAVSLSSSDKSTALH